MVPRTVLTRSGPILVNTARPVNTVQPRTAVNNAGPMKNVINNAYSTAKRPFNKITAANNSNFTKKVNIVKGIRVNAARPKVVISAVKGNKRNAGNPQQDLKNKGVIDSRCSRHMTGNRSYLTDYEEVNGGFVAFRGNSKGGKITRKGKIRTSKLDFEDVYFVKEIKFNLFSVSQMCDRKNSVLFTDTECVVLSPDFKLTDESHVLLKVPRKDNMYNVDIKNVISQGSLTFLFAKGTPDESNLWHRRLGHVNFKTMNKLVRGSLVRGLPSKLFEINQTCIACQKGKQHRASCKTKTFSLISQPLQMLHLDLFGLTFVKSLMKKMYCLVVTDDFSMFSWVFLLATIDETSEILKTFIIGIENLIDLKMKVIRFDNGIEFKNRVMNQLCEMKGIKREYSVARTPQQNRVAERKNRTLIEAARTMLANLKLPTIFWAEAVNTACYVKNRVLVIKPQNKTPYELFLGRKLALSFMRPFGCPVTILNTIDHLGTKACNDTGKARMETVPGKDYILLPMLPADLLFSQDSKSSLNAGFKPSGEEEKKDIEDPRNETRNQTKGKDSEVPINAFDLKTSIELPNDPNMPKLEDIVYSDDDEDVGAEADMNNLDAFMPGSPYSKLQGIHSDPLVVQIIRDLIQPHTRRMIKNLKNMIEAIGLFLGPMPYLKDFGCSDGLSRVIFFKHDFIFGSTKKSLCTEFEKMMHKKFQMSCLGELTFYIGLQVKQKEDRIFISQDKYVTEILKNFGFSDVKTTRTPMETRKPLLKDADGEDVDEHLYRSVIGSLMYLTSSRPDIMFPVCACIRFQVNPKSSHLHAVKRIFRYLKGQPQLGLWYPKDSPFDLVAYTDSDYARASLDRKSTTGGCQFLGCRLISWHCKNQTVVANSITKAEYIVASNCCGQTKHVEIRHHFIKDSNEKKLIQMIKIHTNQNDADLLTKAFDVSRFQYLITSIGMLNL
ncbi:putative ribonuclease H-like domain-containing protein [Tanacetum coccineum]